MEEREGRSLEEHPTWTVATVITVMVALGFLLHICLKHFAKWLDRTKKKSILAALEKIQEELMLFGLMSLLMGHWIVFVAKICVKSSAFSRRFFPCALKKDQINAVEHVLFSRLDYLNKSVSKVQVKSESHEYCQKGHESFASHESLEQLHRLIFVLGMTHVVYSFFAIILAMIKIYSWRTWENEAKIQAVQVLEDAAEAKRNGLRITRLSTFIFNHASHPWSHHKYLVWLLCFSRQFWSSINRPSYMALRFGFITTHQLPLSYDFLKYMIRSMEDEFRDIVGISVPLWIYAICCIILDFHGSNFYFWLSFLPAILILLIGTKLHHIVVKLAVEIMEECPHMENQKFKLRDELFWFKRPRLLLRLIQLISFQNAFEMATFIWSLWEIKESSCFMDNHTFLVIRLTFGVVSQFWCSFITFPLYVIITQMGSRFKKSVVSENVRESLYGWKRRVKARQCTSAETGLLGSTSTSITTSTSDASKVCSSTSTSTEGSSTSFRVQRTSSTHPSSNSTEGSSTSFRLQRTSFTHPSSNSTEGSSTSFRLQRTSFTPPKANMQQGQVHESDERLESPLCTHPRSEIYEEDEEDHYHKDYDSKG